MNPPAFRIPIEDRHSAEFWMQEWYDRFGQTKDYAFKEAADAMRAYIVDTFAPEDDV